MSEKYLMELINMEYENEYIEFKHNWFDKDELGKYISAISNSAAEHGVEYGYFIWGIDDKAHKIVGTTFNSNKEINNEPLKHYLARNLTPSLDFKFEDLIINNKKVVVLTIPAAVSVITEFNKERNIRIGSSKELLRKYPLKEANLWMILSNTQSTIINTESPVKDLEFSSLLSYYMSKNLPLNQKTFKDNLHFYVPNTKKYNELAYILSDNNQIICRVSIFNGKSKANKQYALNEFGKKSILITIDQILNYLESFNITRIDETNRIVERKDISLFDSESLREALLNAFIHNDWTELNAPMISMFTDRIEILSYGSLPFKQTIGGFFDGRSTPRCQELANIFLQLRISERSGRGVLHILNIYSKDAFDIKDNYIKVTIPFSEERSYNVIEENEHDSKSSIAKKKIIFEIRNKKNITTMELMNRLHLGKTSIQKYLKELTDEGFLKRVGSKKTGYWEIVK